MYALIACYVCQITFNSHVSFEATGKLVDEHYKAKHPELIEDPDQLNFGEADRLRFSTTEDSGA